MRLKANFITAAIILSLSMGTAIAVFGAARKAYGEKGAVRLRRDDIGRTANVRRFGSAPRIDGVLDDAAWRKTKPMYLEYQALGRGKATKKDWVKTGFDDENFYIAAMLNFTAGTKLKAKIKDYDSELYKEEDFEFFLYPEPDPRMYYQFMVNPIGTRADIAKIFDQADDRIRMMFKDWNGKWDAKVKVYNDHWTVEAVVPWETMGVKDIPEVLQFQALRGDKTATPYEYPVWSPVRRRPTEGFGILNLTDHIGKAIEIEELALKRIGEGKVGVSGMLKSAGSIGQVKLMAWYSDPYSPPKKFTKELIINDKKGSFNWNIDTKNSVNGFHQFVIKAIPEKKSLVSNVDIYNFNQTISGNIAFSDIILNPIPKKLKWGRGRFTPEKNDVIVVPENATDRTVKTAVYLADRFYALYGLRPEVKKGGKGRIRLSVNPTKVSEKAETDWREAYLLNVTSKSINIVGAGEAGLYYGVVTLMQIAAAPKQPKVPIKAVSITDWPTYKKRINKANYSFHSKKDINGRGGYNLERMKDRIRRRVAGSKYNVLELVFADNINYPSRPELYNKANFTPKDIREICDFAREHFVEVIPGTHWGAHSYAWTIHYPELIDPAYGRAQMDITNPKVYTLMKDIFYDLIEMAGKPVRYFNTSNDEWWHMPKGPKKVIYKGKTRQELFLKFLLAEYNLLAKKGIKMVMFSDMLLRKHNGRAPFNLYKVAGKLPRDIVFETWSYSNEPLVKQGFKEAWRVDNGFSANNRATYKGTSGFGTFVYPSIDSMFNHSNPVRWLSFCFHTEMQAANYAWNKDEKGILPMEEWTIQYMPNLMGTYSMSDNPAAGTNLTPISFGSDGVLAKELDLSGRKKVGDIPMELGAVKVEPGKAFKIDFTGGTRISSLYILDNVALKDAKVIKKLQQLCRKTSARPYGLIIGKYVLNYTDGSKAEQALRLGRNISFLKYAHPRSRFIKEARALYPLTDDQSLALIQFEWVNPHPEKIVRSFELTVKYEETPVLLCGITIRNTKK